MSTKKFQSSDVPPPIFSGDRGKQFWEEIWEIVDRKSNRKKKIRRNVHSALYTLGCLCQEHEDVVRHQGKLIQELQQRLAKLEGKK